MSNPAMTTLWTSRHARAIDRAIAGMSIVGWLAAAGGAIALAMSYLTFVHPMVVEMMGDADPATRHAMAQSVTRVIVAVGLPAVVTIAIAAAAAGVGSVVLALRRRG
jgi:hypothetical protein